MYCISKENSCRISALGLRKIWIMKLHPKCLKINISSSIWCLCASLFGMHFTVAQSAASLGAAGSFAVLGGSTVTDAGGSLFYGDVGVSPGTSITGIVASSITNGSIHENDSLAMQAHADAQAAYGTLAALSSDFDLTGQDLGTLILAPGVYSFSSSAQLTGTLTLDGSAMMNPEWIFQIGSTLTTASDSEINVINALGLPNVFFQVGSSATLGTGTDFTGTILADQSITTNSGTTVSGRLLAINAAVTLDNTVVAIPEPGVAALSLLGIAGLAFHRRRGRFHQRRPACRLSLP